jgi:acylphosphatase
MRSVKIRVTGRVQGVGFRYHTMHFAMANQISGFVKNLADGSVYIEATGNEPEVELFIEWCRNGPKWAWVESVEVQDANIKPFLGFSIK